jgi:ABC-2 type transport system permease protein
MNTMKWLLKRELWENKGMLFWAPVIVAGLITLLIGTTATHALLTGKMHFGHDAQMAASSMPPEALAELVNAVANGYMALSAPLLPMLFVVAFFYCISALYDERRDRSILFWKSLPVSDQQTVLSKVLTIAVVAPLITLAMAVAMSVLMLVLGMVIFASHGVNLTGALLSHPAVYLTPLRVIGMLPIYVLWALPTIGWLLMVSAWARSKVFLWAVGAPLLSILVVKWTEHLLGLEMRVDWFVHNIVFRVLGSLAPGVWLTMEKVKPENLTNGHIIDMGLVFRESWMLLTGPNVWLGAAAGVAMIFAAIRLRRWKDEG